MALVDGVSFVAASSGTGTFVYSSSRASFRTPAQAVTDGDLVDGQIVSYVAQDSLSSPTQREWGYGIFSASGGSITRAPLGGTSGATTLVSFTTPPVVSLTVLAQDIPTRAVLTADANGEIDSATGSDSNRWPGTLADPLASLQYFWDYAASSVDGGGFSATANLEGAGPYTLAAVQGLIGFKAINIVGAGSGTTTVNDLEFGASGGILFPIVLGAVVNIDSANFADGGNTYCVEHAANGTVGIGTINGDVQLTPGAGTFSGLVAAADGAEIILNEATFNAGNYTFGISAFFFGNVQIYGTVTCAGTPTFDSFLFSEDTGLIYQQGSTFSGASSPGISGFAITGGLIDLQGLDPADLPGGGGILCASGGHYEGPTDQIIIPTNGGTVAMLPQTPELILLPAGNLTTTVVLPDQSLLAAVPFPPDGQRAIISNPTAFNITALATTTPDGSSIVGAPSTLNAGTRFELKFNEAANTWYLN